MKKWQFKQFLPLILILITAITASAGSWTTIQIEEMPTEIKAGQLVNVVFTVRQHGQHLVHELPTNDKSVIPITPVITIEHTETGETQQFTVQRAKQVGYFTAALQFPTAGEWSWHIESAPLHSTTELPSLTIKAAAAVSETVVVGTNTPIPTPLLITAVLLLILGSTLFLLIKRPTLKPTP